MNGRFSDYHVEQVISELLALPQWMTLFASDPFIASDPLAVEIVGGVFARQSAGLVRIDSHTLANAGLITWHNLLPGTVVHAVGTFDASVNGHLRTAAPADESYPNGGTFLVPAGAYVVTLDLPTGP